MAFYNRTYRLVDGERIEGTWRHVFIENLGYHLTDLKIYADGMIDCWGLVDLAGFRQKVASGWIATKLPQGGRASAFQLAVWRFDQPRHWISPEQLIAEVADEIERLAGRPTSEDRCIAALQRYLDDPSAEHLEALRAAYLAVPEHQRVFLLGDQDTKDGPLRTLLTPVGERDPFLGSDADQEPVRQADHDAAWAYFRERREQERRREANPLWEEDSVTSAPSVVRFDAVDGGHAYLANEYPAPLTVGGETFPTVEHAYWALATTDPDSRERILRAATAREARAIGLRGPHRPDWPVVRLAIMTRLVREKFRQHPDLAARLVATGDGRLINGVGAGPFWAVHSQGRNWLGRILELVRAELVEGQQA